MEAMPTSQCHQSFASFYSFWWQAGPVDIVLKINDGTESIVMICCARLSCFLFMPNLHTPLLQNRGGRFSTREICGILCESRWVNNPAVNPCLTLAFSTLPNKERSSALAHGCAIFLCHLGFKINLYNGLQTEPCKSISLYIREGCTKQTSQELRMLSPSLFIQGSQCKC